MSRVSHYHFVKIQQRMRTSFLRPYFAFLCILALTLFIAAAQAADCSNPDGITGEIIFNADHKVLQYCNSENWIAMGSNGGSGTMAPAGNTNEIQYNNAGNLAASPNLAWSQSGATTMLLLGGHPSLRAQNTGNMVWLSYANDTGYGFIGPASGSSSSGAYIAAIGKDNTSQVVGSGGIQMGVVGVSPALAIISPSGNVGIGTATPQHKLDVSGSIRARGSSNIYVDKQFVTCAPNTSNFYDCSCPAGYELVTAGVHAGPNQVIRESRPMSTTTWRVLCTTLSGVVSTCSGTLSMICSRVLSN